MRVEDSEANLILRIGLRSIKFFLHNCEIKPHFYHEKWGTYRHLEVQWLWFLFVYENDGII